MNNGYCRDRACGGAVDRGALRAEFSEAHNRAKCFRALREVFQQSKTPTDSPIFIKKIDHDPRMSLLRRVEHCEAVGFGCCCKFVQAWHSSIFLKLGEMADGVRLNITLLSVKP